MQILTNIDFLFTQLSDGVRYQPAPPVDPNARPTNIKGILKVYLSASSGKNSVRTFNNNIIRPTNDVEHHSCFQFIILDTGLQFVFERDEHGYLVNLFKLNGIKLLKKGVNITQGMLLL